MRILLVSALAAVAITGCNEVQSLTSERESLKKELFDIAARTDDLLSNSDDFTMMNCRKIGGKHGISTMAASASIHGNTLKISTRVSDYSVDLTKVYLNEPVILNEYMNYQVELQSRNVHGVKFKAKNIICRSEKYADLAKEADKVLTRIDEINLALKELRKGSPDGV